MSTAQFHVLSLYSGAGGLDWGFRQAGFKLIWAIDSDAQAIKWFPVEEKFISTTWPRSSAGPGGSELSHAVAAPSEGMCSRSKTTI